MRAHVKHPVKHHAVSNPWYRRPLLVCNMLRQEHRMPDTSCLTWLGKSEHQYQPMCTTALVFWAFSLCSVAVCIGVHNSHFGKHVRVGTALSIWTFSQWLCACRCCQSCSTLDSVDLAGQCFLRVKRVSLHIWSGLDWSLLKWQVRGVTPRRTELAVNLALIFHPVPSAHNHSELRWMLRRVSPCQRCDNN